MHGLINRAVDEFLRETYPDALSEAHRLSGVGLWRGADAGLQLDQTQIARAAGALGKAPADMLEDLGSWLARQEPMRRLLRFSGRDFREFVSHLDELPGRALLVLPDLALPDFVVTADGAGTLALTVTPFDEGTVALLAGVLRAMADDYGALGLISVEGARILIEITDDAFTQGRDFQLGAAYEARQAAGHRG